MCVICRHAWWAAELTEGARLLFRADSVDFGFGAPQQELAAAVEAERAAAHGRGTSCRPDQLALVPVIGVQRLAASSLADDFAALVADELTRKGG